MENDTNTNFKKYIYISILIVVISLLTIFVINYSKSSSTYIILDNYIVKYEDGIYDTVSFEDGKDRLFRIIVDRNYLGNYYTDHYDSESDYIFFRLDDQSYVFTDQLLGLQDNVDYIDFEKVTFNKEDLKVLNSIYSGNEFKSVKEFTEATKAIIDLDNNGIDDIVYSVNYQLDDDYIYSTVFVNLNGEIEVLDEDQGYDDGNRVINTTFSLQYIVDIDKDDKYELILSKSNNDVYSYSIYSLDEQYVESYFTGFWG